MDRSDDLLEQQQIKALLLILYTSPAKAAALVQRFPAERYEVISCPVLASVVRWRDELQPDVIVLDPPSELAQLLEVCAAVRSQTDRPIIVLSDRRNESIVTRALATGVDEYLVLPIGDRELIARIEAILRRARRALVRRHNDALGGIVLSPDEHSVALNGRKISLSPIEFRLLACLASGPGHVFTHQTLMSRVWGAEYVDSRQYLHIYIGYLREKLEDDPANPQMLLNAWGVGYKLQPPR